MRLLPLLVLLSVTAACDGSEATSTKLPTCPGVTVTTADGRVVLHNASRAPFDNVLVHVGGSEAGYRGQSQAVGGFKADIGGLDVGETDDVTSDLFDRDGRRWNEATMAATSVIVEARGVCESEFSAPAKP